jgi:hypothetical protein
MLLDLKTKLLAFGGAVIALLVGSLKFMAVRNRSLKDEVKSAKAQIKYRGEVDRLDAEIEQAFSRRAHEARRHIDEDRIPGHLAEPDI